MTITEMAQRISQLERALEIEFGAHSKQFCFRGTPRLGYLLGHTSFALLVSKSYTNTPLVLS